MCKAWWQLAALAAGLGGAAMASAQVAVQDQVRLSVAREEVQKSVAEAKPGLRIESPAVVPPGQEAGCIPIQTLDVQGVNLLPADVVNAALKPFATGCLGVAGIDGMLQALTGLYIQRGYITSRAYIPEQDLSTGALTLVVVEGYVEAFVYGESRNGKPWDKPNARRLVRAMPMQVGDILNLRALEQGIDQLSAPVSAAATLDIQPGSQVGASVLAITVEDTDRLRGTLGYRLNRTTDGATSAPNMSLGLDWDNLLGRNETFHTALSGGIESNALSFGVSMPARWWTLTADLSYAEQWSQLTAMTELFERTGGLSLTATRLMSRDAEQKTKLEFGFDLSHSDREINGTPLTAQGYRSFHLAFHREKVSEGRFRSLRVQVAGGTTNANTPFESLSIAVQAYRRFGSGGSLFSTYEMQMGSAQLPGAQAFSIGGAGVVRGFEETSASAPSGLRITQEYTLPPRPALTDAARKQPLLAELWRASQRYGFVDFGVVADADGTQRRMASVGVGLRLSRPKFSVDLGLAVPLEGISTEADTEPGLRLSVSRKLF